MTPSRPVAPVRPRATERLAVRPLGLTEVELSHGFWADWQRLNRDVTIPHALEWLERDGSVDNLRDVAAGTPAAAHRGMWFSDSDAYKLLEGLSWDLGRRPSAELSDAAAELIEVVRRAQEDDGYLNSFVQAGHGQRWDHMAWSHELYCMGHLVQAAVAHHRATAGNELLAVAQRAADCVVREFGDNRRKDTDGHPIIEMALVELYRETGQRSYLDLAQQFVDVRGYRALDPRGHFDSAYYQDETPVRQQTTVVGHAVRALYLLSGVVDVYLETGEKALLDSALRQWESMTATKTYLNGAVGSRFDGESFGDEYELPQDLVYGETCATIAAIMLSWRLLLATGESRFADAIERALFNLFAASTSVERNAFFYNNPAHRRVARPAAAGNARQQRAEAPGTRPPWFQCACCPPNIVRTIASLGGYLATYVDAGVQIHQYAPATIAAGGIRLIIETDYPLDGTVDVRVAETGGDRWTLSLRLPAWCRGATVSVNGTPAPTGADERGYVNITREWRAGDSVTLVMPMPVRLTLPHPAADAVRGTVAIERGPIVYCLESPDQPDGVDLNRVELLVDEPLAEERRDLLGGGTVPVVHVAAFARDDTAWAETGWATVGEEPAALGRRVTLTAIPYRLWANRGPSVMRIFVPARRG